MWLCILTTSCYLTYLQSHMSTLWQLAIQMGNDHINRLVHSNPHNGLSEYPDLVYCPASLMKLLLFLLMLLISLSLPDAADLDAALGLHQLQFSLGQLQLQLPQLLLQPVLLLIQRLGGSLVPARGRRLKGPEGVEQVPTVLTAHYFTLHGHTNTGMLAGNGG